MPPAPGGRLFDPDGLDPDAATSETAAEQRAGAPPDGVAVRIRPDVSGLDREFDYLLPSSMAAEASIGSLVRVELNGRNVGGWITAIGIDPPAGVDLRPITRISSVGPSAELIDLARWAARRWHGRVAALLKTASPPRMVRSLPSSPADDPRPAPAEADGVVVHRMSPNADVTPFLAELAATGNVLVVTPRIGQARALAGRLRRQGVATRVHPRDWAAAAARGGLVIGARSAVWARLPDLSAVVVLDEHDEALQEERNPTWHARDVAIERAARAGVTCHLVSPAPTLTAVVRAEAVHTPSRRAERDSWPVVELVDRRNDEPGRSGLFSARLAEVVRGGGTLLAVLNRKGRAVMLACVLCGELVRSDDGDHLMVERDGRLVVPSTGEERPVVCARCGATKLKRLRLGVTRAAEELSALAGEPVDELTGSSGSHRATDPRSPTRIVVGTEAALHQLGHLDTVVFLDFDQELLAARYRSAEQAMALLVLAARSVGDRAGGGRIIVQTRLPEHRVLRAAVRADPGALLAEEEGLRRPVGWPPFGALAEVSGQAAAEFVAPLGALDGLVVLGPRDDGRYLLRADDPDRLAALLAATDRPSGRFRVAVDPPRA